MRWVLGRLESEGQGIGCTSVAAAAAPCSRSITCLIRFAHVQHVHGVASVIALMTSCA
jgi:hypothetical protein